MGARERSRIAGAHKIIEFIAVFKKYKVEIDSGPVKKGDRYQPERPWTCAISVEVFPDTPVTGIEAYSVKGTDVFNTGRSFNARPNLSRYWETELFFSSTKNNMEDRA